MHTTTATGARRLHPRLVVVDGLQQSTKSGHWALFDLSSGAALQQSLATFGEEITSEQADCASDAYKAAGEDLPLYFALAPALPGPTACLRPSGRRRVTKRAAEP